MDLSNLQPAFGSHRNRKRIGRGHGSGTGKTAGKGHKGQKARAGGAPVETLHADVLEIRRQRHDSMPPGA